jgi:hypothetical protein
VVPHLPDWVCDELMASMHQSLMDELFEEYAIINPIFWYYTLAALAFTNHLQSSAVVYDCMDELSTFQGAPSALRELEQQLLQRADIVFTVGQSLYEAKNIFIPIFTPFLAALMLPILLKPEHTLKTHRISKTFRTLVSASTA